MATDENTVSRKGVLKIDGNKVLFFKFFDIPKNTLLVKVGIKQKVKIKKSGFKIITPLTRSMYNVSGPKQNITFNPPATDDIECADRIKPIIDIVINAYIDDPVKYLAIDEHGNGSQTNPDEYLNIQVMKAVDSFVRLLTYEELEKLYQRTTQVPLSELEVPQHNINSQTGAEEVTWIGFSETIEDIREKTGIQIIDINLQKVRSPKNLTDIREKGIVAAEKNKQEREKAENENQIAIGKAKAQFEAAQYQAQSNEVISKSYIQLDREQIETLTPVLRGLGYSIDACVHMIQGYNRNPNAFTQNLIASGNNELLSAFMSAASLRNIPNRNFNNNYYFDDEQTHYNYVDDNNSSLLQNDGEYKSRRNR